MVELSFIALFLLSVGCLAAGVVAAVVHTWSLRALTYSLETRLNVVEGALSREIKARAGQERWKKPSREEEAVSAALAVQKTVEPPKPWWQTINAPRAYHG